MCDKAASAPIRRKAKADAKRVQQELQEFLDGADERSDNRFFAERDGKDVSVECAVEKRTNKELSHKATETADRLALVTAIHNRELPKWLTK